MEEFLRTLAFGGGSLCLGVALVLVVLFAAANRYDNSYVARTLSTLTVMMVLALSAWCFWHAVIG